MAPRKKTQISDGLVNIVANLGTGRDKAASTNYVADCMPPNVLLSMYRASWLARAIVDYPAEDATRKWRYWRGDSNQITLLERLEKRLKVKSKTKAGMVAARLWGGAALYMNTANPDQRSPLIPGREEIKSLVVLTRNNLVAEQIVLDINNPYYGKPEFYTLTSGSNAETVTIHASRLAIFSGADVPDDITSASIMNGWGDSVLQSTMDAIKTTDSTMANIASMVFEAKVDVFKFEGFAEMLENTANDALITRRLTTQAAMKGINGAVVIDTKDDYQQKSASFSGLPDVVNKFIDTVSGAAKIPVTRLYGRSAVGLSGSGDGDERVYFDRIGDIQETDMGEAMETLDECLIHQALGSRPPEVFFEWKQLRQLTELERADIFGKTAAAARAIAGTTAGEIIPLDALSKALTNEIIEQGVLPGLEAAIEEFGTLNEQNEMVGGEDPPLTQGV